MAGNSKIEWTDVTWNPLAGCSVISPGCKRCYAMRLAARLERMRVAKYAGLTDQTKAGAVWNGKINFDDDTLLQPLRWKKPRRIFVNSMSDLFHESVPDEWIDKIFAVMALAPQHTFQVLTKRADRMRAYLSDRETAPRVAESASELAPIGRDISGVGLHFSTIGSVSGFRLSPWPLSNVWLGVSVEDQQRADERIPDLLATPAAVRFLSCEPLLGPVDFRLFNDGRPGSALDDIDWVIAGGESGPGARPAHPDWFRSLRAQCAAAGAAFFLKQWGEWAPAELFHHDNGKASVVYLDHDADETEWPSDRYVTWARLEPESGASMRVSIARVGKKRAGRLLDGVTHDGMPGVRP